MIKATYSGIGFPPRKSAGSGFFHTATDEELLRNSVFVILNTKKGSMPGNREFGSSAQDLLFEPINEITQSLIADLIKTDIERWEPRLEVYSLKAASIENTRIFEIVLRVRSTGQTFTSTNTFAN